MRQFRILGFVVLPAGDFRIVSPWGDVRSVDETFLLRYKVDVGDASTDGPVSGGPHVEEWADLLQPLFAIEGQQALRQVMAPGQALVAPGTPDPLLRRPDADLCPRVTRSDRCRTTRTPWWRSLPRPSHAPCSAIPTTMNTGARSSCCSGTTPPTAAWPRSRVFPPWSPGSQRSAVPTDQILLDLQRLLAEPGQD
jgi:hypothetical protein